MLQRPPLQMPQRPAVGASLISSVPLPRLLCFAVLKNARPSSLLSSKQKSMGPTTIVSRNFDTSFFRHTSFRADNSAGVSARQLRSEARAGGDADHDPRSEHNGDACSVACPSAPVVPAAVHYYPAAVLRCRRRLEGVKTLGGSAAARPRRPAPPPRRSRHACRLTVSQWRRGAGAEGR